MKQCLKSRSKFFISIVILCQGFLSAQTIDDQITQSQASINANRQDWFNNLHDNIITKAPEKGSQTAEWDREVSNQYQSITGDRLALANADKSQDASYLYYTFTDNLLGTTISRSLDLRQDYYFYYLESLYKQATYAWDDQKNKSRSIDFILKDRFKRGRPYQVLDANGNYLNNYETITGSSFPSGHTWNGFRQAVTLAILFPEKGGEIFARAIEYGESRVIVGAHFGTDTIASRVGNYHTMAQLLADDDIAKTFVNLARETRAEIAYECNMDVRSCLEQNSQSLVLDPNSNAGYYNKKDPAEAPRVTPDEIPDLAAYLLRLRFPYLTNDQWKGILASTAYPSNSLAGWNIVDGDPDTYWGLINLPDAYNGPSYFYNDFIVNQDSSKSEYDISGFSSWDTWKNNISGNGRLIKMGDGTLNLSGNNDFAGVDVNDGHLIISGTSQFQNESTVNSNGVLMITGALNSDIKVNGGILDFINGSSNATVTVDQKGRIIGNGTVGSLHIKEGGIIAPGHSMGQITVTNNLQFDRGSQYQVEISYDNRNDFILNQGNTTINGGIVTVSLENKNNILTQYEVNSLLGKKYHIIHTAGQMVGQFDAAVPNYLFIGAMLEYTTNDVILNIGRNNTAFASAASTFNEVSIANALEFLPIGNPIYETFLEMDNIYQAKAAFNALSGQIHADVMATQIDASRNLRELIGRRSTMLSDKNNAWVEIMGNWDHVSSDGNAYKYNSTNYGIYLGADALIVDSGFRFGIAGGYTYTSLSGHNSDAKSDNFHLALYASKTFDDFRFSLGAANTWHKIDTTRTVSYGRQYDKNKAKYNATTQQIFTEFSYLKTFDQIQLEPFVNIAYVYYKNDHINEDGGAAALNARKQHLGTALSVVGLRASKDFQWGDYQSALSGEIGWQHQFSGVNRELDLNFRGGSVPFASRSVSAAKNSMNLKLNMDFSLKENATLSVGYDGSFAKRHKNNSVTANFTYKF